MKIKLITMCLDNHTIGKLYIDDKYFSYSLELPCRDNKINVSCIPPGKYELKPVNSPRFGNSWEVADVRGRSHILIHVGNTVDDVLGCIVLGSATGMLRNSKTQRLNDAVLDSRNTVNKLHKTLDNGDSHTIEIVRY